MSRKTIIVEKQKRRGVEEVEQRTGEEKRSSRTRRGGSTKQHQYY